MNGSHDTGGGGDTQETAFATRLAENLEPAADALSDDEVDVDTIATAIVDGAVEFREQPDIECIRQEIDVLLGDLEGRCADLRNRLASLEQGRPASEETFDHVRTRFDEYEAELYTIDANVGQLRRRVLPGGASEGSTDLQEWLDRYETANERYETMTLRLDEFEADLDAFADWLENVDRRVDEVEADVEAIETDLQDLSATLDDFESRLDAGTAASVADPDDRNFCAVLNDVGTRCERARETLDELETWTRQDEGAHPTLRTRLRELRARLDEIEDIQAAQVDSLERIHNEHLDARVEAAETRHATLRNRVERLEAGLEPPDQELDHVRAQFDAFYARLDDVAENIDDLYGPISDGVQLSGGSTDWAQWRWWVQTFDPEVGSIESQLGELGDDLDSFERWLNDIALRVDDLESDVGMLEADTRSTVDAVAAFEAELDVTTDEINTIDGIDTLETRYQELTTDHERLQARLGEIKELYDELLQRWQATESGTSDVRSRLDEVGTRIRDLESTCGDIERNLARIKDKYLENVSWHRLRIERRVVAHGAEGQLQTRRERLRELRTEQGATFTEAEPTIREIDAAIDRLEHGEPSPADSRAPRDVVGSRIKTGPDEAYVQKLDAVEVDVGTVMTIVASLGSAAIADDPIASGTFVLGMFSTLYEQTKTPIRPIDGFVYWVGHTESDDDDRVLRSDFETAVTRRRDQVEDRIEIQELNFEASLARLERNGCIDTEETDDGKVIEFKMQCKSTWGSPAGDEG